MSLGEAEVDDDEDNIATPTEGKKEEMSSRELFTMAKQEACSFISFSPP